MLKAIQLGQQLTKKEMKNVTGGGTCQVLLKSRPGTTIVGTGSTYAEVQAMIEAGAVSRWCCDSCGTASWAVH